MVAAGGKCAGGVVPVCAAERRGVHDLELVCEQQSVQHDVDRDLGFPGPADESDIAGPDGRVQGSDLHAGRGDVEDSAGEGCGASADADGL